MRIRSLSYNDGFDCRVKWRMTDTCNYSCPYCARGKNLAAYSAESVASENAALAATAEKISALLSKSGFKKVKIDLIGGEVSLLDLESILSRITAENVAEYNITTNLSKSADFYISLASKFPVSMTASLHESEADFDVFFAKAERIKASGALKGFKCETVSCADNQETVGKFIEKCGELGIDFIVDRDKSAPAPSMEIAARRTGESELISAEFTDGTSRVFKSKAELLGVFLGYTFTKGRFAYTKGLRCTNSEDYLYIDKHTAVGRRKDGGKCAERMPVDEFEFLPAEKCKVDFCSLCGRFRLYTEDGDELPESRLAEAGAEDETEDDESSGDFGEDSRVESMTAPAEDAESSDSESSDSESSEAENSGSESSRSGGSGI